MQVMLKYLIVASMMVLPLVLGVSVPNHVTKLDEKRSCNALTKCNKNLTPMQPGLKGNGNSKEQNCDSLRMESKTWMFKENMIIGY
jgi:hypothetical protein